MKITSQIEVAQSPDVVWELFSDIPQVAACLPGTSLTSQESDTRYTGEVVIKAGPVRMEFAGAAEIQSRDDRERTIQVEASGADRKGRGQATLLLGAAVAPSAKGSLVDVSMDLALSGAAAQFGRGLVADVTAVLLDQFGTNLQARLDAIASGADPDVATAAKPASGTSFAMQATRRGLARTFRRFFLPYEPQPTRR
ncbi:MAG: SRPBCC family protein [Nitriliruptoraceae bacterium]